MRDTGFTLTEAAIRAGAMIRSDASVAALELKILRRRISRMEQRYEAPDPAPPSPPAELFGGVGPLPRLPLKAKLESYAFSQIGRANLSKEDDARLRSLAAAVRHWIDDPERQAWEAACQLRARRSAADKARICQEIAALVHRIHELELQHAAQQRQVVLQATNRFVEREMIQPNSAFIGVAELFSDGRWKEPATIEWAAWRGWSPLDIGLDRYRFGSTRARNLRFYERPAPPMPVELPETKEPPSRSSRRRQQSPSRSPKKRSFGTGSNRFSKMRQRRAWLIQSRNGGCGRARASGLR